MHKPNSCFLAALIAAFLPLTAYAQSTSQAVTEPTRLALQIVFLKGQPPSLYPVASAQSKPSGGYATRFGKVAGWQPPQEALPLKAVQVTSRKEGEIVKVQVAVLVGRVSIEREDSVINFEMSEGQERVIAELTKHGVEPIEIKLVRVPFRGTVLPNVINKTKSLILKEIIAGNPTLPAYRITLQNASSKDVVSIEVNVVLNGRKEVVLLRQGERGQVIIPPGDDFQLPITASYQVRPSNGNQLPDLSLDHNCIIQAVVFRDGSYEGAPYSAARYRAMLSGQRQQIFAVSALLQDALNSSDAPAAIWQRLKSGLASLNTLASEPATKALLDEFPSLSDQEKTSILSLVQHSLKDMKIKVTDELSTFEKGQQGKEINNLELRELVSKTKAKYDQWLSML